ncbi:MAG TPA: TIM barrel protein [Stellaceae bacterium]|nr:TIM barrel protein [Stellaceae bacterium]
MLRSIATVSLGGTLPEKLKAAAGARFDGVEIFENDLVYFDDRPRAVRELAGDLGLEILMYQPFRDFEGAPRAKRQRNLDRAERKFDVMAELGANLMLLCSNVSPDAIPEDAAAIEDLALLAERAAQRGIRIGYEALAWGRNVNTYGHAWRLIDAVDHPNLGLALDSFHTLALGDDTAAIASIPGDRIFFVQVADAPLLSMDVLQWSRHFRCFPGQGQFDLAGFLAPVIAAGYGGPLSLEIFNDEFRAAPSRPTADDGMRSLLYLEEATDQRLQAPGPVGVVGAGGSTPSQRPRVDLFSPPLPPKYDGVEFLEFAVDDAIGGRLAQWLGRLGFATVGRHKSKNVTLLRNGGIHLVLNAEPNSFAHSFFLVHGPSLCAMALGVDNSGDAVNRARLYRCQPHDERVGPHEQKLPGIRAPDGSVIYLLDPQRRAETLFATDFIPVATPAAPAGLTRIDHTTLALPPGHLDSWLLFFRAVFGFGADDTWVLPDPYGLIRSRAVRSPDRSIRIPLNISQSQHTAIARSVSTYGGSGVHHIACATDDIFATVRDLKLLGADFLEIPRNYYEDLATKFDITADFAAQLADANVLYDRDGEGEFLHIYTRPFEDRFFFEIVERRNYDQYGAANAAVRLAALAQERQRSPYRADSPDW